MKRKKRNPLKTEENKRKKKWREQALERANHKCEWCGAGQPGLNVHHIISKRYKPLRTDPMNSMVLCPKCHKFGIGYAAHENPIMVSEWLKMTRPLAYDYLYEKTLLLVK